MVHEVRWHLYLLSFQYHQFLLGDLGHQVGPSHHFFPSSQVVQEFLEGPSYVATLTNRSINFYYSLWVLDHLELLSYHQDLGHPNNHNNNNNHITIGGIELTGGPRDPCFPGGPLGPSSPYTVQHSIICTCHQGDMKI